MKGQPDQVILSDGNRHFIDLCEDLYLFLTGGSAKWSLASNARVHDRVRRQLLEIQKQANEGLRSQIVEILTSDPGSFRQQMIDVVKEQREKGVW